MDVLLKDETKHSEMISIMETMQKQYMITTESFLAELTI